MTRWMLIRFFVDCDADLVGERRRFSLREGDLKLTRMVNVHSCSSANAHVAIGKRIEVSKTVARGSPYEQSRGVGRAVS